MKPCTDAEMRAEFERHHIPPRVLGERFSNICELLQDTAPEGATELDVCLKAGFYLDDRGSLEWEDDDVCELDPEAAERADKPISAFDAINVIFAPTFKRAEANADRIHQAWLDCQASDDDPPEAA